MKIDGKQIKIDYCETYNDQAVLKNEYLPVLKHIDGQFVVTYAQLLKHGRLSDGREFQEIRVILQEKEENPLAYADKVLQAEIAEGEKP